MEKGFPSIEQLAGSISDGLTSESERSNVVLVSDMLYKVGDLMLGNLIERLNAQGEHISCIVHDSFLPWVTEVAKKFNIPSVFFWTQSCAVYSIYHHHFVHGKLGIFILQNCTEVGSLNSFIRLSL